MNSDFRQLSVEAIEGIGPRATERLAMIHIYAVADLLRFPLTVIHEAVQEQASLTQVHQWRAAASLLQLASMTPQWAEALVKAGIETVARFAGTSLKQAQAAFTAAEKSRIIPAAPGNGELFDLFKQAVIHQHTGVLRGTVRDARGQPLAGIDVRYGSARTTTDQRGRFDLLHLPLFSQTSLVLSAEDQEAIQIEQPRICHDPDRIDVRVFRYAPDPTNKTDDVSELSGQPLGSLAGRRVLTLKAEPGELRENDILLVRHHDEDKDTYRLVSKLKSVIDGDIRVHTFELPASRMPADVTPGDMFRVRNGELSRLDAASFDLGRYRRWLGMRRATQDIAPPTDEQSHVDLVERKMHAFFAQGIPRRIFRRG